MGKKPRVNTALNKNQLLFVSEYLKDFNATGAAIRAGYSEKNASPVGSELLRHPSIKEKIDKQLEERNAAVKVDAYYVVKKLLAVSEANFLEWIKFGKTGVDQNLLDKMPIPLQKMVTQFKCTYTQQGDKVYTFKFIDKTKCLELLGKHTGAFMEKIELDGKLNLNCFTDLVSNENDKDK